jgi:hypothetical protein
MARMLTLDDVQAGVVGGLFLSAGDPGIGVLRRADAGYEAAIEHAEHVGLSATLPESF